MKARPCSSISRPSGASTAKFFEKTVLHTKPVEDAIKSRNVVTMYADFTDYPPEIDRTIKALGGNGVPVIAVFPGGAPYEPIVFRGGYRQKDIIDALAEAKSRRAATEVSRDAQTPLPAVSRHPILAPRAAFGRDFAPSLSERDIARDCHEGRQQCG